MVLFEEILEVEVARLGEIQVNANVNRKPKFGWGNSDELRKFIEVHGKSHFPFIWCVPRQDSETAVMGMYQREVELNLCTLETRKEILNTQRTNANYSYQQVLVPLWESLLRLFENSDIDPVEGTLRYQLFPNYKVNGQHEAQEIWDVLKVIFTANYSKTYTPCKGG